MDISALIGDRERCELAVQPVVDLKRGSVVGYEALSRFRLDPYVRPDVVFAEANRQGLGVQLEAQMVQRALELAERKPVNCFLALNVDPRHLLADEVRSVLATPRSLSGIVIEITEHHPVDDVKPLIKELDVLRGRGAAIAVDDAGSGYSGLRRLLELRPQMVKLDRELVNNVHEDAAKLALVQMLGELAGRLDAWILAEGIELESELRVLRHLRVPLAQGYFLGRPGPPWASLDPAARDALAHFSPSSNRLEAVRSLLEPCVTCIEDAPWPSTSIALRVSREGRPSSMRFSLGGAPVVREERELLRVKPQTPLSAVALRAMTRAEHLRWDPIVCIDESGQFRGIVRMHRLVTALAEGKNVTALDAAN